MAKWMWIIAGPNGAGKSSFAGQFLRDLGHRRLRKLNADERTLELRRQFPDAAQNDLNLQAAIDTDKEVERSIEAGRSFVVETVLSSPKYRDDVLAAKAKGFKVGLIYVSVHPPELSPQRVSERVAKGGHDVDVETAIKRHRRSHDELRWFAPQADLFMAFDNSSADAAPVLVASRAGGEPLKYLVPGVNPALDRALAGMAAKTPHPDLKPG
jgi:predicted ABC-type ATPase